MAVSALNCLKCMKRALTGAITINNIYLTNSY